MRAAAANGARQPVDPTRKDDLGRTRARTCVAEQTQDHRGCDGAGGRRDQAVPDPETVIRGQQAGGEEACVVDEGAGPKKSEVPWRAVAIARWNRLDAMDLDLAEGIGLPGRNVAHRSPSAGITQFRFIRSARSALSARVPKGFRELPSGSDVTGALRLAPRRG